MVPLLVLEGTLLALLVRLLLGLIEKIVAEGHVDSEDAKRASKRGHCSCGTTT